MKTTNKLTKKLIIISPAHPLRGGIASSTERLAQEFQNYGYEVLIYTFSLQYPNFLFPGKTQYSPDPAPKDLDIKVAINSINPFNWWKIGREISKLRPDIVLTRFWLPFMGPSLGSILRLIKKNGHTKIAAIVDNIRPHEPRIGDRFLAQYFVNAVDAFVVMSKSVAVEMRSFTKEKPIKYIPHPIYDNYGDKLSKTLACEHLKLNPRQRYILFFGFIRDYKGLDLLFKAINRKEIRELGIKLIVAGEYYSNQKEYEALIKTEGIEDMLILKTDFIPNEEVRYYFCAADLIVQPYKSATQSGISQLAYHFEKPMVVTHVGGLPEIVAHGKSGYVVPVDTKAIGDAIIDYFENKRAADYTTQVIKFKKNFSWTKMVEGIEEIIS